MITLFINDEPMAVAAKQTLADVLWLLEQRPNKFAVAVNGQFIAKSAYQTTVLQSNDRVELVIPMQGG
jgi:sulfur carrier protein